MKKIFSMILVISIILSMQGISFAQDKKTTLVLVNEWGGLFSEDREQIKNIDGRLMVPLKAIFDELLADVRWNPTNQSIIATRGETTVEMKIGSKVVKINGQEIELEVAPQIINGRTLVPLRFVGEAFGDEVKWLPDHQPLYDDKTKLADVVKINSQYVMDKENEVKSKFNFTNDIKVFTLFAFLNHTGYDQQLRGQYHPVRKMVRDDLQAMNLNLLNNNYYTEKNFLPISYINEIRKMDGPPYFTMNQYPIDELKDLSLHLQEFYEKANIEELYMKYKPYYDEEINKFHNQSFMANMLVKWNHFLKIHNMPSIEIQYNLLDSHGTGYTLYRKDSENTYKITLGPEQTFSNGVISASTLGIEYLHYITEPWLYNMESEIQKTSHMMSSIQQGNLATGEFYNRWDGIFRKSLVRGIHARVHEKSIRADEWDAVNYFMNEGFILTKYFYDRMAEFPTHEGDLESFINKMILEYN